MIPPFLGGRARRDLQRLYLFGHVGARPTLCTAALCGATPAPPELCALEPTEVPVLRTEVRRVLFIHCSGRAPQPRATLSTCCRSHQRSYDSFILPTSKKATGTSTKVQKLRAPTSKHVSMCIASEKCRVGVRCPHTLRPPLRPLHPPLLMCACFYTSGPIDSCARSRAGSSKRVRPGCTGRTGRSSPSRCENCGPGGVGGGGPEEDGRLVSHP